LFIYFAESGELSQRVRVWETGQGQNTHTLLLMHDLGGHAVDKSPESLQHSKTFTKLLLAATMEYIIIIYIYIIIYII